MKRSPGYVVAYIPTYHRYCSQYYYVFSQSVHTVYVYKYFFHMHTVSTSALLLYSLLLYSLLFTPLLFTLYSFTEPFFHSLPVRYPYKINE